MLVLRCGFLFQGDCNIRLQEYCWSVLNHQFQLWTGWLDRLLLKCCVFLCEYLHTDIELLK